LSPDEFRQDTRDAVRILEDLTGKPVRAYRAPTYSVVPNSTWALEILAELGLKADSSVFPIRHDLYGFPSFPRSPVRVLLPGGGSIVEFPMSTLRTLGMNLPGPGGGSLRILPFRYSRHVLCKLNVRHNQPGLVYLHPWEIDPDQPRLPVKWRSRFRHYTGLEKTATKLTRLLMEFRFASMSEVLRLYPPREVVEVGSIG